MINLNWGVDVDRYGYLLKLNGIPVARSSSVKGLKRLSEYIYEDTKDWVEKNNINEWEHLKIALLYKWRTGKWPDLQGNR